VSENKSIHNQHSFGAVAIGRNEGERLKRCLRSLCAAHAVVYVDSGSSDGSQESAREQGVHVVELDMGLPFTAARARNAGFGRLRELAPYLAYVQFVDGDCELVKGFSDQAIAFLSTNAGVAAVCGRRSELYPSRSIYNQLCDWEWNGPVGEISAFGGDVMIRVDALSSVGGYRDDLIAGEEPELCVRLRAAGWRIWRLPIKMTLHDAAMTCFSQWWRRTSRAGYAFAQGAHLHGTAPERHWVWESRRALLWGAFVPITCVVAGACFSPWGWSAFLIYPLQILRQAVRLRGPLHARLQLALFQTLARFPECLGQFKFIRDRLLGRQARLIEYKSI
jgi:glycosyltransferase involved in cell wall biosynthesis